MGCLIVILRLDWGGRRAESRCSLCVKWASQPLGWCDRPVMSAARRFMEMGDTIIHVCVHGFWALIYECQGITSQDVARPALSQTVVLFYVRIVSFVSFCVLFVCKCATGCQPNCRWQIYHSYTCVYIYIYIYCSWQIYHSYSYIYISYE